MISKGKFNIPANAGTVTGVCEVIVTNMGAVAPGPTIDDAHTVGHDLVFHVSEGNNTVDLNLTDKN